MNSIKFQKILGMTLGLVVSLAVDAATHAARLASNGHSSVNKEAKFVGPKTPLENRTWYFAKLVADGLVGCDDAEALSWEFGKELAARHKNIDRNKFSAYLDAILQGKTNAGAEIRFQIRDEIVQWSNVFFDEIRMRYEIPSDAYSNALIDQLKDHKNYAPETKVVHFAKQTLAHIQKIAEIQKASGAIKCGDKSGDDLARFRGLANASERRLLGSPSDKATVQPLLVADVVKAPAKVPEPSEHAAAVPLPAQAAQAETEPLAPRPTASSPLPPAPTLVTAHQSMYMGAIVTNIDRSAQVRISRLATQSNPRIIVPIPAPELEIETIRRAEPAHGDSHAKSEKPTEPETPAPVKTEVAAPVPTPAPIVLPVPKAAPVKKAQLPPPPKLGKPLTTSKGGQTTSPRLPPAPTLTSRDPAPAPTPAPVVRSSPPPSNTPRIDTATVHAVAQSVAEVTPGTSALRKDRSWNYGIGPSLWRTVDQCFDTPSNFADQIAFFTAEHIKPTNGAEVAPSAKGDTDVTFLSHSFCDVTQESLNAKLAKGVSASEAATVQSFISQFNSLQAAARADPSKMPSFLKLTTAFTSCLASEESMTSADGFNYFQTSFKNDRSGRREAAHAKRKAKADEIARYIGLAGANDANPGARLPPGIELYDDGYGWVLGAYQFSSGEMSQCIYNWNKLYPSCAIPDTGDKQKRNRILASSPRQSFNIFCGINSLTQSLKAQANTNESFRVVGGPANFREPASNRCVSLFVGNSGRMRFGPMRNSTGENLNKVVSCTLNSFKRAN